MRILLALLLFVTRLAIALRSFVYSLAILLGVTILLPTQPLTGRSQDIFKTIQSLNNNIARNKFDLLAKVVAGINSTDDYQRTALHLAAQAGDLPAVESLLQLGADPHLTDGRNRTPFDYAEQQTQSSQLSIVHLRIASLLLEQMDGIDGIDQSGWPPLLWAIAAGDLQRVEELLDAGARVTLWGNSGAASLARQLQDKKILKIIEAYLDLETVTPRDQLLLAIETDNQPYVEQSIAKLTADNTIDDAFLYSITYGHHEAAWLLSEHLNDVNVMLNYLGTPLHHAIATGQLELAQHLLVKLGANPNLVSYAKYSPLMRAIMAKHFNFAHTLLDYGADPSYLDRKNHLTFSVLAEAIMSGNLEITRRIIESIGDINRQCGRPSMITAAGHGNIDMLQLLIDHGGNVNAIDTLNSRGSCLHTVARLGDIEKAQLLLNHGAAVDAQNQFGDTPLVIATRMRLPNMVKFLLQHGANHRLVNDYGNTALDVAKFSLIRTEDDKEKALEIINLLEKQSFLKKKD